MEKKKVIFVRRIRVVVGGEGVRTMSIGVIDFLLISVTCALKLHSEVFCYGY